MKTIYDNLNSGRNDIGGKILFNRLLNIILNKYNNLLDCTNDKCKNEIVAEITHNQFMMLYIMSIEGLIFDKELYINALNYFASKKLRKPTEFISFILNHYYNGISEIVDENLEKEEFERMWIKEFENLNDISKINVEDFAYNNDFYNPTLGNDECQKIYSRLRYSDNEIFSIFTQGQIDMLNSIIFNNEKNENNISEMFKNIINIVEINNN